ncbi:glycosyltransferase family 1 protein [Enterococcus mundtii]|uniref:glycosyltransferase family 1 protein n=1 Tax=Enterococcus mundtii TaxID=53346 RepID=UPI00036A612A|nr:glycosyltransferase family 1 protein [Enterococcus mundtii]OBS62132.1 glycosyl transferase family 1 [Enterococcus mundtii]
MVKRVLHFQGRMGKGGAESFMMNMYRNIDRNKIQFDFLIYDDYKDTKDYHDEIKELGGRIFVVTNPKKNLLKYMIEVNRLLKTEKFDVAHNEVYFGGGINLWLAKKNNIKIRVAHSHATEDGKGNSFVLKILRKYLHWLLEKNATDFVAVSKEAGESLFGDHPYVMVNNGIDFSQYNFSADVTRKFKADLGIDETDFVVGNIGRMEEQKNQLFLLDIFNEILKQNSHSKLVLIGNGSLKDKILNKIQQLDLVENVLYLGERNDIPEMLALMDVFLLPSLYEGLPMVGIEAQASQKKLVLSSTITKDISLTPNVHFVDLEETLEVWAKTVLQKPYTNEKTKELEAFDVSHTIQQMEEIYLR